MNASFERIGPVFMENQFYQKLETLLRQGESVTLLSALGAHLGHKALVADGVLTVAEETCRSFWSGVAAKLPPKESMPQILELEGESVLCERICAHEQLIICGGGHVAEPVADFGQKLDFEVTVLDDRPEFASSDRFPSAKKLLCMPYAQAMPLVPSGANCYYVIVTPGHAADRECLEFLLNQNRFAYIGMIGSRRKVALVREELLRQGYDPALLARVHSPIGLSIGAKTPAEIAVSICAELIQVRSGTDGGFSREALEKLAAGERMMLATIIEKSGSAPRGVGAKLMLDASGKLYGTTGGGAGEAGVVAAAPAVLAENRPRIMTFRMDNDDARKQGMICGGVITVLLEPVNGPAIHSN